MQQTIMIDDQGRRITQIGRLDSTEIFIYDPDDVLIASKKFYQLARSMSELDLMIQETFSKGTISPVSQPTDDENGAQIASSAILDDQDLAFLIQLVEETLAEANRYSAHAVALTGLLMRLEGALDAVG